MRFLSVGWMVNQYGRKSGPLPSLVVKPAEEFCEDRLHPFDVEGLFDVSVGAQLPGDLQGF